MDAFSGKLLPIMLRKGTLFGFGLVANDRDNDKDVKSALMVSPRAPVVIIGRTSGRS